MPELSILDMFNNSIKSITSSKVAILFILEAVILILGLVFSKLMNKKVVKRTTIITSLIVVGFYISNYISTLGTFMNNVTTRLMEFLYFPTTLEFITVMIISLVIMTVTLVRKNSNIILKVVNTVVPVIISFLFLSIIEFINNNGIDFDEFSVFTDPTMMSLYELAMIMFITWIIGLIIYKVDVILISASSLNEKEEIVDETLTIELPQLKSEIELPKLKTEIKNI